MDTRAASGAGAAGTPATDRAYEHVKRAILDRTFAGGELLSEGELATHVGCSRTPVREALLRLETEDLVRLYPKKGALVLPVSPREIDDVLETRELIETHAVSRVQPASDQLAAELAEQVSAMREYAATGDPGAFVRVDREFHRSIVAASGNEILTRLYDSLRDRQLRMGEAAMSAAPARMERTVDEHAAILDALRQPEGGGGEDTTERARTAVRTHLGTASEHLRDRGGPRAGR